MKTAVMEVLPLELAAVELGGQQTRSNPQDTNHKQIPVNKLQPTNEVSNLANDSQSEVKEVQEDRDQGIEVSLDEVKGKWAGIISQLAPQNHSVAGLLRSCRPKKVENRFLVVEAYYKFHKEQLEQEARRRMVEEVLREQTGLPSVRFVLGERVVEAIKEMPEHDNVQVAGDKKLAEAVEDVFGVEI